VRFLRLREDLVTNPGEGAKEAGTQERAMHATSFPAFLPSLEVLSPIAAVPRQVFAC
jgi:hypothetical protein